MPYCPAGTRVKAGVPTWFWTTAGAVLDAIGSARTWFSPIAYIIGQNIFNAAELCATEPVQPAAWTSQDVQDVLNPTRWAYLKDKALAWYKYMEWNHYCECIPVEATGCGHSAVGSTGWGESADTTARENGVIIQASTTKYINGARLALSDNQPDPITFRIRARSGFAVLAEYTVSRSGSVGGWPLFRFPLGFQMQPNTQYVVTFAKPAGYRYWQATNIGGLSSTYYQNQEGAYCSPIGGGTCTTGQTTRFAIDPEVCATQGTTGSGAVPPAVEPTRPPGVPDYPEDECDSIADLCVMVNALRGQVDLTKLQVDLIQRQHVPFAYVVKSTHTNLSGSGELAVQGILGASVSYSAPPASLGRTADTPARYFPAPVSIQFGTADGLQDWHLLHYRDGLVLCQSGAVTRLRYNIKPGYTATIRVLAREP